MSTNRKLMNHVCEVGAMHFGSTAMNEADSGEKTRRMRLEGSGVHFDVIPMKSGRVKLRIVEGTFCDAVHYISTTTPTSEIVATIETASWRQKDES